MFSNINKPAFGTTTSTPSFGFGSTTPANQAPFGQSQLFGKTPSTPGFGTSAPLFGSTAQPPSGTLFSSSSVPSFGATPQTGFGTGLFGQQQTAPGGNGLFASSSTPSFGQQTKSAGFGFGASAATPLFGQQQTQNFQASTSFGGTPGFGGTTQMGTVTKFNPVTGTDTMQKSGITHTISTKHHCITCMKEYESKSLEELRYEDYQCNRRGPQQQSGFGAPQFGAPAASTAPSLFGQSENKPSFGQTTTFGGNNGGFGGLTNQPNQQNLFGKPTNTFGSIPTTNTFTGFNASTPAFGATTGVKAFGTQPAPNVFGTTTTQPSAFGGNTFFGQTNPQNTNSFFSKPAQTAFNAQQPVFTFGQQTTAQSSLFPPAKPATGFPSFSQTNLTTNTGFGQQSSLFAQPAQNPFNAFQKPAQPTFGQPLQPGFGTGAQSTGNTFFGANKPLFGNTTQSNFFSPPSGGFLMPQQQTVPNQSVGFEMPPQQDFHTIVENMYESFPHRQLFEGIEVKNYASDATNPAVLKKIIEDAPLPITPPDNISKLRLMPRSRHNSGGHNPSKFSLLESTVGPPTLENNLLLKRSSSKRLVLRKTTPRSEKDLLEEYKNMAAGCSKNQSLFKNSVLEELNKKEASDSFDLKQYSPSPIQPPTLLKENVYDEEFTKFLESPGIEKFIKHSQSTQTPSKTPTIPIIKLPQTALFNAEDSDFGAQADVSRPGVSTSIRSLDSINATPMSDGNIQNSKSKSGKTVRFLDEDLESSTSAEAMMADLRQRRKNLLLTLEDTFKSSSDEETDSATVPDTCGIKLTRPEYYTIPPLDEIHKYKNENGACMVKGFTVGRYGYGNVYFPDELDVSNLDLDEIVHFGFRNVTIYPDDETKPPVGQELNRPAQVTLDHVWPRHLETHEIIKDPKDIAAENFIDRLEALSKKQNAELIDYRPDTGSWVFTVPHFSKFQFSHADDEEVAKQLQQTKKEQEQKLKEMEQKENEAKALEPPEDNQSDTMKKRGLGGISYQPSDSRRESALHQTLSQARLSSTFRDDPKNALVMKSSFFDEESISDDVSSSDIGIVHHFSIPSAPVMGTAPGELSGLRKKAKAKTPKHYALLNTLHITPIQKSLLSSRNYMDVGLFKSRSFRASWGPGFTLATVTAPSVSPTDSYLINYGLVDHKPNVVLRLEIGNLSIKPPMINLDEHLKVVHEGSTVSVGSSGVPVMNIDNGYSTLIRHTQISERLDHDHSLYVSYYRQVWCLCLALWGPNATTPTEKRELFSNWLEMVAAPCVTKDLDLFAYKNTAVIKNIFTYLSGHDVVNAAELAMDERYPRLSNLISQTSAHESARELINNQLQQWNDSGIIGNMDQDILKIYMLLGSIPVIGGINICENIDWKRALAIHLWYMCAPGTSLIHGIQQYEAAFSSLGYANRPSPEHYEYTSVMVYDVLYHIMQLFANEGTPLEKIINPTTYTEDPLDYRLSWLLLQVFRALQIGTVSDGVINAINVSFSSQLEQLGLWKWSIFVLLFMRDESAKTNAIMKILDRNLDLDRTSANIKIEDSLVNDFKIPAKWIHTVLANKTMLLDQKIETYKHLILKSDWCAAHNIAITHLIPDLISSGQREKLTNLLNDLTPGKRDILHWETEAGLVLDFLCLHEQVMINREKITHLDIRRLKGFLSELSMRIKEFPTKSLKQLLAIAEISRFMAIMSKIVYCELQPSTHKTVLSAMELIKTLVMPPDYKIDELTKYMHQYLKLDYSKGQQKE